MNEQTMILFANELQSPQFFIMKAACYLFSMLSLGIALLLYFRARAGNAAIERKVQSASTQNLLEQFLFIRGRSFW